MNQFYQRAQYHYFKLLQKLIFELRVCKTMQSPILAHAHSSSHSDNNDHELALNFVRIHFYFTDETQTTFYGTTQ